MRIYDGSSDVCSSDLPARRRLPIARPAPSSLPPGKVNPMYAIARSELVQIFRNRSVLITGLFMPAAASLYFIYFRDSFPDQGGLGYIAAVLVFTIGAFGLYATTVTTLAARRQNLFLKRLRSTAASDPTILSGLILPVTAISLVQVLQIG